jgi:hypothetical protein
MINKIKQIRIKQTKIKNLRYFQNALKWKQSINNIKL